MDLRLKGQEYESCFFLTTSFHNHSRHGHKDGVYEKLAESIRIQQEKHEIRLISYVFMPSHLHLVVAAADGAEISGFMRDMKKYTSQKSLSEFAEQGRLWQSRYDRVALWSYPVIEVKVEYCHSNPVRAGLVANPEDWFWSSAADYLMSRKGPLEVWKEWK